MIYTRVQRRLLLSLALSFGLAALVLASPQDGEQRGPDGHYHDQQGNAQPDACDNMPNGPDKDKAGVMHDCQCNRAASSCDVHDAKYPGSKCQTYCRDHACKCASPCDS